jgi:malate dehydrogenase
MKKSNDKVAVIGAGNVGATLAMRVFESGLADVVLVDILPSIAEGKALDISDNCGALGSANAIIGTDDYSRVEGSRIVAITAGFARKPGMSREELVSKNASIVKDVVLKVKAKAPDSIIIVVTNPLDAMTYLAYKTSGFDKKRVMGMAGTLDESRFVALISKELNVDPKEVKTVMMGSHGDTMVPVLSRTTVGKRKLTDLIPKERLDKIVDTTRFRGAQIVNLLGSGSAYYSPSLATFRMIDIILSGKREVVAACAFLDGEYGLSGICIGVPVLLGRKGIESVVEIDLAEEERSSLLRSEAIIRKTMELLPL